jgi:Tol biopolymer transport system component
MRPATTSAVLVCVSACLFTLGGCGTDAGRHGGTGGSSGTGGSGGNGNGGNGNGDGGSSGPSTVDVVPPALPPGVVGGFDGAPPSTSGLTLAYPNAGAVIPHDLAQIDAQWNGSAQVYRVSFAVDTGDRLRGYSTTNDWLPDLADWQWLLDRAAGHTISISVEGGTMDAMGNITNVVGSPAQPLGVSKDDATGALFYFATTGDQLTGDGTLERLQVGAQMADKYLNKTNDGGRCVGCHTLSRDGTRVAFDFLDLTGIATGGTLTLGSVDATDPTKEQAAAGTPAANASFSPDNSKLVVSYDGKLQLRDGTTGAAISNITTSGDALFPDWSPDGNTIVFVRPSAHCTASPPDFGQSSIFAYGGSLVTVTNSGGTFGNETVILAAATGENNYYPTYSPDGMYVAFTRASTSTKSSWSLGNTSCAGQDGSGLSYDNPSATLWIVPAGGGAATQLSAANQGPMLTNSWPKWSPKSDGEYLWLSFSSTRPYGNVLTGANAHHQLWITSVTRNAMGDASTPGVWFPFQDTTTKNHIGTWAPVVGGYQIP